MASIGTLTAFLGMDTKGLKKGQGEAKSIIGNMKGLIGSLGVALSVAGAFKIYEGFEKDAAAIAQLDRAITATKGSAKTATAAMAEMDYAVTKLGSDEVLVNQALENLVTKTQDAEAAVADFGLVQDVSAKFGMELGGASDLVAKAATGQFKAVVKLLPYMKSWADSHKELAGTAEGAVAILTELDRVAGGEAEKKAATALGQIQRLKNIQAEMLDEVGRLMTGSEDTDTAWKSIADSAEQVLRSLMAMKGAPIIQTLARLPAFAEKVSVDVGNVATTFKNMFRGEGDAYSPLVDYGAVMDERSIQAATDKMNRDLKKPDLKASSRAGAVDTSEADAAVEDARKKLEADRIAANEKAEADAVAQHLYWQQAALDGIQYRSDILAAQVAFSEEMLDDTSLTAEGMSVAWERFKDKRLQQIDEEVAARTKAAQLSPAEAESLRVKLVSEMNFKDTQFVGPEQDQAQIDAQEKAKKSAEEWGSIANDGFKSVTDATAGFFTTQKGEWASFHESLRGMLANMISSVMNQLMKGSSGGDVGASIVGGAKSAGSWLGGLFGGGGAGSAVESIPFIAAGGVVSRPTLSMIGESGPEAVIPLSRFRDQDFMGRLAGTGTDGPSGGRSGRPVVINIQAQDAQSFRASSSQISARLALAVRQAERNL
jgi:hypothetical protein